LLIDRQNFVSKTGFPASAENGEVFLYCGFSDLEIDGRGFDGALIGCKFENIDWYWGLFNEVLISKTKFVGCKFRGTSFVGCRFLYCEFEGCEFAADNVGGFSKFKDCVLVECKFRRCASATIESDEPSLFMGTRLYGCTQAECVGLAELVN
jgi:uncharacterized protein YjbI with pentapeptide repeats